MVPAPMSTQPCRTELGRGSFHTRGSSYGIRLCCVDIAVRRFWWETKFAIFFKFVGVEWGGMQRITQRNM